MPEYQNFEELQKLIFSYFHGRNHLLATLIQNYQYNQELDYFDKKVKEQLIKSGYKLNDKGAIGRVDGILVRADKMLEGGADKRGDDTAIGF